MTNLKRHMQHKRLQGFCTEIVNDTVNNTDYSQTEGKDKLNRCDFGCVLPVVNVRDRRKSTD